jgi:hypothetical protein
MVDDNDLINRLAAVVPNRIRPQILFDYETSRRSQPA